MKYVCMIMMLVGSQTVTLSAMDVQCTVTTALKKASHGVVSLDYLDFDIIGEIASHLNKQGIGWLASTCKHTRQALATPANLFKVIYPHVYLYLYDTAWDISKYLKALHPTLGSTQEPLSEESKQKIQREYDKLLTVYPSALPWARQCCACPFLSTFEKGKLYYYLYHFKANDTDLDAKLAALPDAERLYVFAQGIMKGYLEHNPLHITDPISNHANNPFIARTNQLQASLGWMYFFQGKDFPTFLTHEIEANKYDINFEAWDTLIEMLVSRKAPATMIETLMKNGAAVHYKNRPSLIHKAIKSWVGNIDVIRVILTDESCREALLIGSLESDDGAKQSENLLTKQTRFTPLIHAIIASRLDVLELLLEKKASLNVQTHPNKFSPLNIAVLAYARDVMKHKELSQQGDAEQAEAQARMLIDIMILRKLLQAGAPLEARDSRGATVLFMAVAHGLQGIFQILMDAGANLTAVNNTNANLLHAAAIGNNAQLIQILIDSKKFDVNSRAKEGRSPLHGAAYLGTLGAAGAFLKNGANIDAQCDKGNTSLHFAVQEKKNAVVTLLLEKGADKSLKNLNGQTPLDVAKKVGNTDAMLLLQ